MVWYGLVHLPTFIQSNICILHLVPYCIRYVNYPRINSWASCFIDNNLLVSDMTLETSRGFLSTKVCPKPILFLSTLSAALWSLSITRPQLKHLCILSSNFFFISGKQLSEPLHYYLPSSFR